MCKENENQDKKLLDLPCNFIKSIKMIDSKVFKKVHNFFSKEYIALSYHQDFEDDEYRKEWVENLGYLDSLTTAFKGYSSKEIDEAFEIAFKVLDKNRQNVLQGKEASNV
jgi:hypothetical protein